MGQTHFAKPWQQMSFSPMGMGHGAKGFGKSAGRGANAERLKRYSAEQRVWVGGLTKDVDWKKLQEHFDAVAKSKWIETFPNGTAVVCYENTDDVSTVIGELNGSQVGESTLELDVWTT